MMPDQRSYRKLLYQYEILRARLEIREHYLATVVKEVYDNIGQVLSLIRVQLTLLRSDFETAKKENLDPPGELVGKTIRDLRNMCQLFHPEADMITGSGFNRAVEQEIKTWCPEAICYIDEGSVIPGTINEEKGLVLFGILLEMFDQVKQQGKAKLNSVGIKYTGNKINMAVDYSGEIIKRNKNSKSENVNLSIFERAELLGGKLQIKNCGHDCIRIKLVIPIN
jgi:nitrate/nitrite-specific signal transduction histidine kinase